MNRIRFCMNTSSTQQLEEWKEGPNEEYSRPILMNRLAQGGTGCVCTLSKSRIRFCKTAKHGGEKSNSSLQAAKITEYQNYLGPTCTGNSRCLRPFFSRNTI